VFFLAKQRRVLFQESKIQTIDHHLRKINLWLMFRFFIQPTDFELIQILSGNWYVQLEKIT
jgi:hypothetical protein